MYRSILSPMKCIYNVTGFCHTLNKDMVICSASFLCYPNRAVAYHSNLPYRVRSLATNSIMSKSKIFYNVHERKVGKQVLCSSADNSLFGMSIVEERMWQWSWSVASASS